MKVADSYGDRSWNHEVLVKVVDTNHLDMSRCLRQSLWQVCDKPVCVALMEFSPLQYTGKVGNKVCGLSWTQITKVVVVICVADFRDLCPQSRTLSYSQHNGIWALWDKLFGLYQSTLILVMKHYVKFLDLWLSLVSLLQTHSSWHKGILLY